MEFTIDDLGADYRTVKIAVVDDTELRLAVVVGSEYAARFTRSEALALAGALRAMAKTLDKENSS